MAQPYSTAAAVLNQVLTTATTEAHWSSGTYPTTDVELRIVEADTMIDSELAALGYSIPFGSNPALLLQLSVAYARYAIIRDLRRQNGSLTGAGLDESVYKEQYDEKMALLRAGQVALVDSTGAVITRSNFAVKSNTSSIPPIFTLDDAENLENEPDPSYLTADPAAPAVSGTDTDGDGDDD